jgi:hypothetical protein
MRGIMERYKLYLGWEGYRYEDRIIHFDKAWFFGPVLKKADKINPNDFISLDFSQQNSSSDLFLPSSFFIARLRWNEVAYTEDKIMLYGCNLTHNKAGTLQKLEAGFSFLIDCSKHESYTHYKNLVYPAWVMNRDRVVI